MIDESSVSYIKKYNSKGAEFYLITFVEIGSDEIQQIETMNNIESDFEALNIISEYLENKIND